MLHNASGEALNLAFSAVFVQNLVLVYMLWTDRFHKWLKNPVSGLLFGALVTAAATLSAMAGWAVSRFVLEPLGYRYLSAFAFMLIIALLELAVELLLRRFAPGLRAKLGALLPAAAFNCAVLGLVLIGVQENTNGFWGTAFYGLCAGVGFILALFAVANAVERARFSAPPASFRGLPIVLIVTGIISLGFMGFAGAKIPF